MQLLEREAELAVLHSAWDRARRGIGGLVLVAGESGIGKTSLVEAFASGVSFRVTVLWGGCTPLVGPPPFEPLREVAPALGSTLTDLIAADAPLHAVSPALLTALTDSSCVLVLDDLQGADEATLDVLRLLVRRIRSSRSLVIGIHRDDEVGPGHPLRSLLGDVARTPEARQLRLAPLSREAVAQVVTEHGRDPDEVLALTGGNPFFVQQIASADGETLPQTVRDAVLARTAGLSLAAQDVLGLLACTPEAVPDTVLPALAIDLPTLRALEDTGLLDRGARGLRFRHELCRRAIADVLPPGGEVLLHARVLAALEAAGHTDSAVLTHHALGAKDAERVLRYAPEAARRAAVTGAHTQAADELLDKTLPLAVERDLPICYAWQLGARGRLNLLRGRWDAALREADDVLRQQSAPVGYTWAALVRGLVELRRGDPHAAAHLEHAWEFAQRMGEPLRLLPACAAPCGYSGWAATRPPGYWWPSPTSSISRATKPARRRSENRSRAVRTAAGAARRWGRCLRLPGGRPARRASVRRGRREGAAGLARAGHEEHPNGPARADPDEPRRPHLTPVRGPGPARGRTIQRRAGRAAVHLAQDRGTPHLGHPDEAPRVVTHGGDLPGPRAGCSPSRPRNTGQGARQASRPGEE